MKAYRIPCRPQYTFHIHQYFSNVQLHLEIQHKWKRIQKTLTFNCRWKKLNAKSTDNLAPCAYIIHMKEAHFVKGPSRTHFNPKIWLIHSSHGPMLQLTISVIFVKIVIIPQESCETKDRSGIIMTFHDTVKYKDTAFSSHTLPIISIFVSHALY